MAVIVNEGTQTAIATDTSGTLNYQVINVKQGTISTIGTLPNLPQGSIQVTAGTVTVGTVPGMGTLTNIGTAKEVTTVANLTNGSIVVTAGTLATIPNIPGGTLALITRVSNIGTLEVGTISTIPNTPGGTLNLVTTVTNLSNGTIQNSGTTTGVGTVTNIGTLAVLNAGTLTTIPNIPGGTLGLLSVLANGTIGAGTVVVGIGTITHGTIDAGTVKLDGRTSRNILSYGTTFGGTAAGYATLVGSAVVGAGTSLWINDVSVNNPKSDITCLVGFGTALNGSSVILKGVFGTASGVGQQKSFSLPVNAGMTNQDLVAYISDAGTINVNVSYFISA